MGNPNKTEQSKTEQPQPETPKPEQGNGTEPINGNGNGAKMLTGTINGQPNIFRAMFSEVLYKPAAVTAKTYTDEGNGRKSRKVANVLLEMAAFPGVFIKGSVRAVQEKNQKKPHAEFNFFGAQNQGICLVADSERATADLVTFKRWLEKDYSDYRQKNAAQFAQNADVAPETEMDIDL